MSESSIHEDSNFLGELRRAVRNKYVNAGLSYLLVAAGLYLAICAAFDRSIIHPLTPSEALQTSDDLGKTVITLLVLLLASVAAGWLFSIIKLPALFGALLMGVAFRNIPLLYEMFDVDQRWEYIIRLLALACIIIRWGVGLNTDELIKRPILPLSVGIVTPIVESAVIALTAHFIFGMHLSIAIICGVLMAAVSPAVTVPVMLELKKKGRGERKGVPTIILAASSIDNLFCIGAFSSAVSLVFTDSIVSLAIMWSIFQVIIGILGGFFLGSIRFLIITSKIGWLFWWFPLPTENPAPRILLLGSASAACVVGLSVVGWATTGIIAAIIFCSLSATRWRKENNNCVRHLEQSFATVWNFVCLPLLFALIGRKLVFDELTSSAVWTSLALIGMGAIARLVSTFVISMCTLPPPESFFMACSMVPKATVQAALAPGLLIFTTQFPDFADDLRQTVTACVLTILVAAPLGELILSFLGGVCLESEEEATFNGIVHEIQINASIYSFDTKTAETKVIASPYCSIAFL